MKYYKIDYQSIFPNEERVLGHANGKLVPNARHYFDRMGEGEIIKDAPVFDYFFLKSFGEKKDWEWRLQDVHGFIEEYPTGGNWYISTRFKELLEQFNIAKDYYFYPTKLLYKGEKLDYWIFQIGVNSMQNIDFTKSVFYIEGETTPLQGIKNEIEFHEFDINLYKTSKRTIFFKKTILKESFDFVEYYEGGKLVSERLKQAIETAGLEGFEFSEIDYEIGVG